MTYYLSKHLDLDFNAAIERVKAALKDEGFGVLTEIDIQATLKAKLGADFRPYRILGACNPPLALKALSAEDKIGVMLPCNVIVQDKGSEGVEVAAIDPTVAMTRTENAALEEIARDVKTKLQAVLARLGRARR